MIRRRSTYDPLADHTRAHWLTVSDMIGHILESTPLDLGADLRAVLTETMNRMTAEGWTIENDARYGSFFCHRDGVRRFVSLSTVPPGEPLAHPSRFGRCLNCDE